MKIFRSGVDRLLALDDYQGRYSAFSDSLYLWFIIIIIIIIIVVVVIIIIIWQIGNKNVQI